MNKFILSIFVLWSIFLCNACYVDDSTPPNPERLPFENFTEFFEENNEDSDLLIFRREDGAVVTTENVMINISSNAFAIYDSIGLEYRSIAAKSDFVLLNRPTVDGDTWLESVGAFYINPYFNIGQTLPIENPLAVEMDVPSAMNLDELQYYKTGDVWSVEDSVMVTNSGGIATFETTEIDWQMIGKEFEPNGTAELTIDAFGNSNIPVDVKAFVILSDYNVVLPLEEDVAQVKASGLVPTGTELTIVAMVMDNFKLNVGTSTLIINEDQEITMSMSAVSVEDMISIIQDLD